MAEVETAALAAAAAAAAAEEPVVSAKEESPPAKETETPEEEEEEAAAGETSEANDHKRKMEDLEPHENEGAPQKKQEVSSPRPAIEISAANEAGSDGVQNAAPVSGNHTTETPAVVADAVSLDGGQSTDTIVAVDVKVDGEQSRLDGETAADGGHEVSKLEAPAMGNGQHPSAENLQKLTGVVSQEGSLPSGGQQPSLELSVSSRKIEVPNNKVGVLIGKSGDIIRNLQTHSGAKIQITRDAEADPYSSTRPVELIGTLENINKAEQLIKDVIAEADAGGSPALVARGFNTAQSGGEQTEIQVPNEKVGLIIGKGGETIKNLQTRSGARIQLIPQHLPEGDVSKGRTVRITGNKKQIESAREMIKEVMNQVPSSRLSQLSGGYTQHTFRPRGPTTTLPPWGARAATPTPTQPAMGYDHQPRGSYPPQTAQYPPQQPQPYGGYSQQPPARIRSFGTGWGQERPAASVQSTPHSGGYDYYAQGGQATNTISSSNNPMATAPSSVSAPINYNNYGQSQAPGYGHPTPYSQTAPAQQNYGHGYNEPKYDQAPSQQIYGQQPGVYGQQASTPQQGYNQQQPYGKPGYGQEMPQSYGPSRESQQGDQTMYQSSMPSSYGSSTPTQQSYPYGSGVPSQPAPAYGESYGSTSGAMDGYNQQLSSAGYPHQGGQDGQAGPGYGQGGQPVPAYTQPGTHSGVYGQYPSSQPSYGDQPVANNVNYGYQGGASDPAYGSSIPSSGYGALPPVSSQSGYVQPPMNPSGYYEQSAPPQSGYSAVPGSAPVGYAKSSSPQPGYGGPYDSVHMYGQH